MTSMLANRLLLSRRDMDITQVDLAQRAGNVSAAYISDLEEENRRDLTIAQMARWYGVNRKTISRDLSELGYILEDGILKDNSPP